MAFLVIRFLVGFDGFYGQDSYEYLRYSDALRDFYLYGTNPGDYFWPVMYPLISSVLSLVIDTKCVLVLISFGSFLGIIGLIRKVIGELYPDEKSNSTINLFILITLCFSPYFFRSSLIGMSDMLACFFMVCSLLGLIMYNKSSLAKWGVLFVGMAVAAFMTRYVCAVMILPMGSYFIYLLLARKKWGTIGISVVVTCLILLPHFLIRGEGSMNFLGHSWLTSWNPMNFFENKFATQDGFHEHPYINLLYLFSPLFHPGYLLIGAGLLVFSRFKIKEGAPCYLVVGVVLYLIFIGGIQIQNMRFFVVVFPFCVILFYPAFARGKEKLPSKLFVAGVVVALLSQTAYFTYSFSKFNERHLLERAVAEKMLEMDFEGPIYSFSLDIALKNRGVDNEFRSLWSSTYSVFERGGYVLFNVDEFEEQWKDKAPMINWNKLVTEYQLILVIDFGQGWKLYAIE